MHISKFKPGTFEKNSSTIGPPAGIEPTPLAMPVQCSCHFFNILGCVGSPQHNGMLIFVIAVSTYSGDDGHTTCKPRSLAISLSAIDFPLDISPTAVLTEH